MVHIVLNKDLRKVISLEAVHASFIGRLQWCKVSGGCPWCETTSVTKLISLMIMVQLQAGYLELIITPPPYSRTSISSHPIGWPYVVLETTSQMADPIRVHKGRVQLVRSPRPKTPVTNDLFNQEMENMQTTTKRSERHVQFVSKLSVFRTRSDLSDMIGSETERETKTEAHLRFPRLSKCWSSFRSRTQPCRAEKTHRRHTTKCFTDRPIVRWVLSPVVGGAVIAHIFESGQHCLFVGLQIDCHLQQVEAEPETRWTIPQWSMEKKN